MDIRVGIVARASNHIVFGTRILGLANSHISMPLTSPRRFIRSISRERDFLSIWHQDEESQGTKEGVMISGHILVNVCPIVENLKILLFLEKIILSVFIMLKRWERKSTGSTCWLLVYGQEEVDALNFKAQQTTTKGLNKQQPKIVQEARIPGEHVYVHTERL
ncbi:hypothetical protein C5167_005811 [Papaver somniferum]|uniref:Uncharacterized protein n=1 Tax=Papaver somniferum TaxID=3469 RepID=A0A4Y7JEP0_PAPSO|nr:hypothetical protein C5167_005811 [Papaver somniferum]